MTTNRPITHQIHLLPNSKPVNIRPYRYTHFQKTKIERQVNEMLSTGLIQLIHSPFSPPVLLVKKKDGSWRFYVDYRALNSATLKDRFPMPTIDELMDELGNASWFSKLDLRQGFHQILMAEHDTAKTIFRTHLGYYEYKVMSFGLCNTPSTFQSAMKELLKPFLHRFVIVFFDDILVYSPCFADHLLLDTEPLLSQGVEVFFRSTTAGVFGSYSFRCWHQTRPREDSGYGPLAHSVLHHHPPWFSRSYGVLPQVHKRVCHHHSPIDYPTPKR